MAADITTNKNMGAVRQPLAVPDVGLRFGTPAITTRGVKGGQDGPHRRADRPRAEKTPENEENIAAVRRDVNAMMAEYPLFAW